MPPHWRQVHHLVHWAHVGPSDLDNADLLCKRHHHTVHSRRLARAVLRDIEGGARPSGRERVQWDLTRGLYDELLATRAAQEPA